MVDTSSDNLGHESVNQVPPTGALTLIDKIRQEAKLLPSSVPEGTVLDVLARFTSDPTLDVMGAEEPWEVVNKVLHSTLGYGASIEELAKLIRRGPYGIVTFTCWVEACIRKVGIDGVLLEDRLARMLQAVESL